MHTSTPKSLTARFRAFFTSRLSAKWFAHLALVEVLIFSLVVLPCTSVNGGFSAANGEFTIWVEAGRATHYFAIHDNNPPSSSSAAELWTQGGKIQGSYPDAPNGMFLRDLTTNEVTPLPDNGNGTVTIAPGAWVDANGASSLRTVYFIVDPARVGHQFAVLHPDGTIYLATVNASDWVPGFYTENGWSETGVSWGSARIDPAQSFRIADITLNEQCSEGETWTAWGSWEPIPVVVPVQMVTIYMDASEAGNTFTVHSLASGGTEMLQSATAAPVTLSSPFYTHDWSYFVANSSTPLSLAAVTVPIGEGMSFWLTRDYDGADPQTVGDTRFHLSPQYVVEGRSLTWMLNGQFTPLPTESMTFYVATSAESEWWWSNGIYVLQPGGFAQLHAPTTTVQSIPDLDHSGNDHTFFYREYTASVKPGQPYWIAYPGSQIFNMGGAANPNDYSWTILTTNAYEHWFWNGWSPMNGTPVPPSGTDTIRVVLPESRSGQTYALYRGRPNQDGTPFQERGALAFTATPEMLVNPWNGQGRLVYNQVSEAAYTYEGTDPQGWFLRERDDSSAEAIQLHAGENDLRNWHRAQESRTVQISLTRWNHDLRIRCEDGSEFLVDPTISQGDISSTAAGAWFNPNYYFDATSFSRPGIHWFVWDETMQEAAAANVSSLVTWHAVRAPSFDWVALGYNPLAIQLGWSADPYETAAVQIQRALGEGLTLNWEPLTTVSGTMNEYADMSVTTGQTYSYRLRGVFGDLASEWSEIRSLTIPGQIDSDGDGIYDAWELIHFGNLSHSGTDDSDGDGLTNAAEFAQGTNPTSSDTDADGMPDGWEVAYGLRPTVDDARQDLDFDMSHNLTEFLYGTDPADHYNGTRPNIVPPQPTTVKAGVADGHFRVEWDDNSISETAFAIYKRALNANGTVVFHLLGKETPAATLFEKDVAPDEVQEGDQIVVIAEPSNIPSAIYVAAIVNQPLILRCNETTQTFEVVQILEEGSIQERAPSREEYAPPPTMSATRAPTKANMLATNVTVNSAMIDSYTVPTYSPSIGGVTITKKVYSTVGLSRVEGEEWQSFAAPTQNSYSASHSFQIGKVNTLAVYTGTDFQSSGGLSAFLDEEYAGVSGSVSAYFDTYPYDPSPNIPSLSSPDFWATHAGPWFHRPFEITQTALPNHSAWPVTLGSWSAQERDNERDASFVQPGIHDLSAYWQFAGGLPEGVYLDEQVNISVGDSFSYPLPGNLNERRFIVSRAWGTVTGEAEKRFDPLADSYPTYFAIPEPGREHAFSIQLHGNPADASEHGTLWTVQTTGGVTFTDGNTLKTYDELNGSDVGFKTATPGGIEFFFNDIFAGKIIVKAYPRKDLSILHVGVAHVDPTTNQVSQGSVGWTGTQSIQKTLVHQNDDQTDEVWLNGGPNVKITHHHHPGLVNMTYKTKNNKTHEPSLEPYITDTDAIDLTESLNAGLGALRGAHDIVCFWVHHGGNDRIAGIAQPGMKTIILLRPDSYTVSHELGHALRLSHPWDWISNKQKPADSGKMIMSYYSGTGFPASQIDAARNYIDTQLPQP